MQSKSQVFDFMSYFVPPPTQPHLPNQRQIVLEIRPCFNRLQASVMQTLRPFYAARATAMLRTAASRHTPRRPLFNASFSTTTRRSLLANPMNLPKWCVKTGERYNVYCAENKPGSTRTPTFCNHQSTTTAYITTMLRLWYVL